MGGDPLIGDVYLGEGHANESPNDSESDDPANNIGAARIIHLDKNGKFINQWYGNEVGQGKFSSAHGLAVDPATGDVWIGDREEYRIVVYSGDGKFIKTWGKKGSAPGELDIPHAIAMDSQGRLFVGDRQNNRIQIFDQDGKFLAEWKQFGRPSGIAIDKNDVIYTADSESTEQVHPGWRRGIRIGSLKDGKVTMFIPAHKTDSPDGTMGEGIAIDAAGNLYTAEAQLRGVTKYVKN